MRRYTSLAFAIGLLAILSLRTSPVSGTLLADVAIPPDRHAQIIAFGDCEDIGTDECSITENEECSDNNCGGDSFNPTAACEQACHVECQGAEDFNGCVEDCIDQECGDLPDEHVKTCDGPLDLDRENRFPDGYEIIVEVDESEYDDITDGPDRCYRRCSCSSWCYDVSPPQLPPWYVCDTTGNCSNFGNITNVKGSTPGDCETPDE